MKRRIMIAGKVIAFTILFMLALSWVTGILSRKDSVVKYQDLVEETEPIDVLFFGSSHVINGVYPMELWHDYGIVSYNCGGHGNALPTTYWVMRNVFDYVQPKLAVIDVLAVGADNKIRPERPGVDQQHISFDWVNLSKNKLGMVNYLLDDTQTKLEFILPISIYHDRWSELKESDFEPDYNVGKGAEYRINRTAPDDFQLLEQSDYTDTSQSLGTQYLCKMIEECQEQGIDVLLVNIPYPASADAQRYANDVYYVAQKYGVNYLNFLYEDTGVDFFTDMYDASSHLNPSGARKITEYLGKYIQETYGIADHSQDSEYADWNDSYEEYAAYKWEQLKNYKKDMNTYLSLLADKKLDICLFFHGESGDVLSWGTPYRMVENITGLSEKIEQCRQEKQDYFVVVDREENRVTEYTGEQGNTKLQTSFADICYSQTDGNGVRSLSINGEETNYLLNDDGTLAELAVVVFDKETGEMVDWARFNQSISVAGR